MEMQMHAQIARTKAHLEQFESTAAPEERVASHKKPNKKPSAA